jgi:hypothetical protein
MFNYIADEGLHLYILNVNPNTGNRILFSGANRGKGPEFKSTAWLVKKTNNQLLVTDSKRSALYSVEIHSGNRTIISGKGDHEYIGSGPKFTAGEPPAGLVLSNNKDIVYVTDPHMSGVNLTTGDRIVVYKNKNKNNKIKN